MESERIREKMEVEIRIMGWVRQGGAVLVGRTSDIESERMREKMLVLIEVIKYGREALLVRMRGD